MSHPSKFLPDDFDSSLPITVIAGKETYPMLTIASIRRHGLTVRLIAFEEETRDDLIDSFDPSERTVIKVGQLGHMLKALKGFKTGYALMAGQITPRRLFKGAHPDAKALLILATLKERNAESIFGAIASEIEKIGILQLGARCFLDHELAQNGLMTGGKHKVEQAYIDHGIRIAREIAKLDIGQGVVVRKGTVIAAEAFEGTDDMLRRANKFKTDQLIFVKTSKPNQDYRFDVPVFGLRTLEVMREAGITLACLESGRTLILEKDKTLTQARDQGIQLLGY